MTARRSVQIMPLFMAFTARSVLVYGLDDDPYLHFQPHFSRSLPVQLLITGIVLTLCTILLIQLLFTWQYHWPLARVNWTLQFSGVCTLLLNVISILYVVLSALGEKSRQWPYMFEYVAISIPRVKEWSVAETAVWYVMEATTSALASITHIQFLTLLYPSRLEARLVFLLLGPLAVVASVMTLLPIASYAPTANVDSGMPPLIVTDHLRNVTNKEFPIDTDNDNGKDLQLLDLIDAARNICNLTLSLLFTLSLLIWGFLVNRQSAWRMDGGTAAFGVGALLLALVSTGLNFLNVFIHPRFSWLSSLLWAIVLWQSFFGWWWWVGSASGIATREIDLEERGRKEQKHAKRKRRKAARSSGEENGSSALTAGRLDRWRSSVGVTLSRRRPPAQSPSSSEEIELATINLKLAESTLATCSSPSVSRTSWVPAQIFAASQHAWRSLRQAHVRAARVQAIEQRQIQIQMELENRRGLGRFPSRMGEEREHGAVRNPSISDDDGEPRVPLSESKEVDRRQLAEPQRTVWWWGPLRNWRLRDSTVY